MTKKNLSATLRYSKLCLKSEAYLFQSVAGVALPGPFAVNELLSNPQLKYTYHIGGGFYVSVMADFLCVDIR